MCHMPKWAWQQASDLPFSGEGAEAKGTLTSRQERQEREQIN